jgi:hypothetical protein
MTEHVMVCSSFPPSWGELAAITTATHKAWAHRHGYDYQSDCSEASWPARTAEWGKPVSGRLPIRSFVKLDALLRHLGAETGPPHYDWVVWLDADQLITNYDIPITRWTGNLEPYRIERDGRTSGKDVVMPFDFNGNNSTTIIARNTDAAFNYLWSCNDAGRVMYLSHYWAEMEAMLRFRLAPPYDGIVQTYSAKELCALHPGEYRLPKRRTAAYEWAPGDFSVHLSALAIQRRVELARYYAETYELLAAPVS